VVLEDTLASRGLIEILVTVWAGAAVLRVSTLSDEVMFKFSLRAWPEIIVRGFLVLLKAGAIQRALALSVMRCAKGRRLRGGAD